MPGKFVLSLDCEGKWGMADTLTQVHHSRLTNANLVEVYTWIIATFDRYEIPATFAFVLAFLLERNHQKQFAHYLDPKTKYTKQWFANYHGCAVRNQSDGWHMPQLLNTVTNATVKHEIASHGFSHLPLDSKLISQEEARTEFDALDNVARALSINLKTMVYPRNIIGFKEELVRIGLHGYRGNLDTSRFRIQSCIRAFAQEFNIRQNAQSNGSASMDDGLVEIPPGYILNFPLNARKMVNMRITVQRWKSILDDAANNNRTALLWLHPHNLIDAPKARESLTEIFAYATEMRERGKLICLTQSDYCAEYRTDAQYRKEAHG